MQYTLQNDKWKVTYIDSNNVTKTFYHPTKIFRSSFGESEITEESIKNTFPTDEETDFIIQEMKKYNGKFDDDSEPWA